MKLDIKAELKYLDSLNDGNLYERGDRAAFEALTRLKRIGELASAAEYVDGNAGFTMKEYAEILRLCGVNHE